MFRTVLCSSLLACFLIACGGNSGDPAKVTYAPSLHVKLSEMQKSDSGLYTQDTVEGTGDQAQSGNTVTVHYTGWLPDGTQFDSSRTRDQPFEFLLGAGNVIKGWDEGVAGMKVGGQRRLVIPSDLGYGARGAGGVIPPNSVLVFDVELLGVAP